jgi:hypothetical protein
MQDTINKIQQELAQFKDVRDYLQCEIPDSSEDMFHKITETFGLEDVEHLEYQKVEGEERISNKFTEEQREENIHKVFTKILNSKEGDYNPQSVKVDFRNVYKK